MSVPYYFRSLDFEKLVKEYPPSDEFEKSIFKWPRSKIESLQKERLTKIVNFAWGNPFYRRKWTEAGISPSVIKSLGDLQKLPIVSAADFKESISRYPPFGDHQGISLKDNIPIKIQTSGGTTGKPRPTFFPPLEWELQTIKISRSLYIQGARPGDIIQIPLTLSTANAGWTYYRAAHGYLCCSPITSGSGLVTPSTRQLELAFEWKTNLWVSFPEYMMRLASVAQEKGLDLRDLKTKFIASYLAADTDGKLRSLLEETWHCDVYDNYGTHELGAGAFECPEKAGLHLHEDLHIIEIVDTDTKEPVETGKKGEIVVTSLYREHPPLIRYNLNDVTRILDYGRCGCGSHLARMDHFLGRSDDMVKIRGTNVFPEACGKAIIGDERMTGEWLCVVEKFRGDLEIRDEMTVKVEYKSESTDKENLKSDLEQRLHSVLGIRIGVELVPPGDLKMYTTSEKEGKIRRLLDKRSPQEFSAK